MTTSLIPLRVREVQVFLINV